ncbi:hypothetical protein [Streptomyces sp. NPDC091212]|uniref:hypothetical protein n=1 Tax=Streptomyces sp. NPDC091212 TaxID=3155191 RepID=UPI00342484E0
MTDVLDGADVLVASTQTMPSLRAQRVFGRLPAVKPDRIFSSALFFPAGYGIALALLDDVERMCRKLTAS